MMKTAIITGATGSMGREAVKMMASEGWNVIMACRNLDKGLKIKAEIEAGLGDGAGQLTLGKLDLSSLSSICSFTESIKGQGIEIQTLFNNAGSMFKDYGVNADGFERTIAVNYVGPYLLTRLLASRLTSVVNMVSVTCGISSVGRDFFTKQDKGYSQLGTYGDSKLALMLFSIALAKHTGLKVNVADPGVVNTGIISMDRWFDPLADVLFRPFCKSPAKGVTPAVKAMLSSESSLLFRGNKELNINNKYMDNINTEWLWQETENILKSKGIGL